MSAPKASKRYARLKLGLSLASTVVGAALGLLLILTPAAREIARFAASLVEGHFAGWLLSALLYGVVAFLVQLPFGYLSGFFLEHRFGLSNQTLGGWLKDQGKVIALSLVLGGLVLGGFYGLARASGELWWLTTGAAFFAFTVVLAKLAPTLLLPLFFRFERVTDPELVATLRDVCREGGMELEGVYTFDMSRQTKKANAAFVGFGRTKRIILGDTLLSYPLHEIRAVVTHEVGHFAHRHLLKGLLLNGVVSVSLFYLVGMVFNAAAGPLGLRSVIDPAALPLLALAMGTAGFLFQPLSNGVSRHFEREADAYAFQKDRPASMAAALRRLTEQNLAEPDPPAVVEWFFHSHPAVAKRIAAAEKASARS